MDATFLKPGPRPESPRPRKAMATRTPARSSGDKCTPPQRPNASASHAGCSGGHAREEGSVRIDSRFCSSRIDILILAGLGAVAQVVHEEADQSANHGDVAEPLQRAFPELHRPGDVRIFRQAAVNLRLRSVMQHVNHAGAANAWWIVHSGMRKIRMIAQLFRAFAGEIQHVVLA